MATTVASRCSVETCILVVIGFLSVMSSCSKNSQASSPVPFGTRIPVELVRVSDGDTIVVRNVDSSVKGILRVRFRYIDCPESNQEFGKEATQFLKTKLASSNKLSLTFDSLDMYNRALGVVYSGRNNVNRLLLENGYAWCYMNRCPANYMKSLTIAKERRLGLWKHPNPVSPWEYRKEQKKKKKARKNKQEL